MRGAKRDYAAGGCRKFIGPRRPDYPDSGCIDPDTAVVQPRKPHKLLTSSDPMQKCLRRIADVQLTRRHSIHGRDPFPGVRVVFGNPSQGRNMEVVTSTVEGYQLWHRVLRENQLPGHLKLAH